MAGFAIDEHKTTAPGDQHSVSEVLVHAGVDPDNPRIGVVAFQVNFREHQTQG